MTVQAPSGLLILAVVAAVIFGLCQLCSGQEIYYKVPEKPQWKEIVFGVRPYGEVSALGTTIHEDRYHWDIRGTYQSTPLSDFYSNHSFLIGLQTGFTF